MECKQIGTLTGGVWDNQIDRSRRVYSTEYISPVLTTCGGGGTEVKIAVWDGYNQSVRADSETVGTLTRNCGGDLKRNGQGIISYQDGIDGVIEDQINVAVENRFLEPQYRIRKLTPLECLRLMGFDDEDYKKLKAIGMSDSQIYKQAGNSIVVNVLEKIFEKTI